MKCGDRCFVSTGFGRLHDSFVSVEYSLVSRLDLDWSYVGNCQEIVPIPVLDKFWLVSFGFSRIHTEDGVT